VWIWLVRAQPGSLRTSRDDRVWGFVAKIGREVGMLSTSWGVTPLIVGRVSPTLIAGHSTEVAHPACLSLSLQAVPIVPFSYVAVIQRS
jgi:hypothetical protein